MVLKTTFGYSQRWSLIRGTLSVENEEKNNLNFANKFFNREDVLILGGRNNGFSLYFICFLSRTSGYNHRMSIKAKGITRLNES